jgi:hypothetical protein
VFTEEAREAQEQRVRVRVRVRVLSKINQSKQKVVVGQGVERGPERGAKNKKVEGQEKKAGGEEG